MKPIFRKLRAWTIAIAGLIAAIAYFISNIDTIVLALGLKHYKAPLVANQGLIPQGAFAAVYGTTNDVGMNYDIFAFPTTNNPFSLDPGFFSVPIITFSITNPNEIDMMISSIFLEATLITTQKVSVGMGPMVAGADFITYECIISTNGTRFSAQYKSKGTDYLKLSPGELSAISISIRSASPGLYRIRPICKYSVGRQNEEMIASEDLNPIYFFDEPPPKYPY